MNRPDPALGERLLEVVERQMAAGLAQGMQLYVSVDGAAVVDEAVGVIAGSEEPITHETRFLLASASKAITITAVHLLADRGLLAYNDPLCRHVEEFAQQGKDAVTIRHALTHQGGFPDLAMSTVMAHFGDWDGAVASVCALVPEYEPGRHVLYHGFTASTILAEVVRRLDGRDFPVFCRDEIFEPLGMAQTTWGLPEGTVAAGLAGWDQTVDDDAAVWRSPAARGAVIAGANAHSTARDLAALYEALAPGGRGRRILAPATIEHATQLHAPMQPGSGFGFGYGFMVGTDPTVTLSRGNLGSARAFGHPGMTFTQAVCDPRDRVVMVFLANVASSQSESDRRFGILCDTVYRAVSAPGG